MANKPTVDKAARGGPDKGKAEASSEEKFAVVVSPETGYHSYRVGERTFYAAPPPGYDQSVTQEEYDELSEDRRDTPTGKRQVIVKA